MEEVSWSWGVEYGETERAYQEGSCSINRHREGGSCVLRRLGLVVLQWLIGGSVEGLEFVGLGTQSSTSEGHWMEVEGLVSDSGWIGKKKQVR